ncbi:hypothetical protein DPEC_G00283960 [Dallia pectoralis]|uniref:Uncharacterized protein n=1 Tax=Dallia pectoralis TaxID=75939 RepID=A0ACC2FJE1_DALPE|nr:hypothetical protein DPEC_G00283960 [Dallia pectoralis]
MYYRAKRCRHAPPGVGDEGVSSPLVSPRSTWHGVKAEGKSMAVLPVGLRTGRYCERWGGDTLALVSWSLDSTVRQHHWRWHTDKIFRSPVALSDAP